MKPEIFFKKYSETVDNLFETAMEEVSNHFGITTEEGRILIENFIKEQGLDNINVDFKSKVGTGLIEVKIKKL